jgi:hydroxymethylpyrimidine pyrophosphatase-like HAD family hydrolase
MGNAPAEVKAVAHEVTGHVDEDGLVPVLRSLLA